jgi:hypothetical protein
MKKAARIAVKTNKPSTPLLPIVACGLLGLFLLVPTDWFTTSKDNPNNDLAAEAFSTYEQLWRVHQLQTADKLAAGELLTEKDVWEFQAKGQEPARKLAFEKLARYEANYFEKKGGWSKEAHEQLLRSYKK